MGDRSDFRRQNPACPDHGKKGSAPAVGKAVSVSFLDRQHLTDRHRDDREARTTYRFSKSRESHGAATYFTLYRHDFCWPSRTLRVLDLIPPEWC